MKISLTVAVLLSALSAQPAMACVDPLEADDRRISDRVVEGGIRCNRAANRCVVSVSRDLARTERPRLAERHLPVQAAFGTRAAWRDAGEIVLMCPGPFEPEATQFHGRFYLIFDDETRLYRVRRYYVRDRDGQFYHLGIRCDPPIIDEEGRRSQSCGRVTAR